MPLQVLTMFGTGSGGTQSAVASIDIPGDGHITGVDWLLLPDLDASDETCTVGLSFASSEDLENNDSRSLISVIGGIAATRTAETVQNARTKFVSFSPGIPVFAGERLYLHSVASAGMIWNAYALVHLDTSQAVTGTMRAASRRR